MQGKKIVSRVFCDRRRNRKHSKCFLHDKIYNFCNCCKKIASRDQGCEKKLQTTTTTDQIELNNLNFGQSSTTLFFLKLTSIFLNCETGDCSTKLFVDLVESFFGISLF